MHYTVREERALKRVESAMPRRTSSFFAVGILILLSNAASALSQEPPPQESPERFALVSEAVILDVVVRDKKGRLITDLTADDFHVFENGKEQPIRSVRFVGGRPSEERRGLNRDAEPPRSDSWSVLHQIHLISLVFDHLNNESRRYARVATEDLLKTDLPPNTFVGVFATQNGLRALSPYTTDFDKVREATGLATSGSFEEIYARSRQLYDEIARAIQSPGDQSDPGSVVTARIEAEMAAGSAESTRRAVEQWLLLNILEKATSVETEFQGQAVLAGIEALVSGQRVLPGRKTVLFFSEGMFIPERLTYLFRKVISESNLANVSIYAVDARGLTSQAQNRMGAQALGRAATLSQAQVQTGGFGEQTTTPGAGLARAQSESRGNGPVGPDEIRSLETAEDSIRMNVQEALEDLSRSTGGFLTANTNDAGRTMKKLAGELQQYYEIVYIPEDNSGDSGYRKIRVEVDRDSVIVQSRDGYYLLPSSAEAPVPPMAFEAPLLESLNRKDQPREFPLRSRSFHFDRKAGKREQIIAASIPVQALEFIIDNESQRYSAHLSVLALVKDGEGEVVAKLSRDYPIEGPLSELEEIKKAEVVFLSPFEATPGRYHVEVAAYDHRSKKTSTKRQVLVVPRSRTGISLSSLMLVASLRPLSELERLLDSPLKHADHQVIPQVGQEIEVKEGGEIGIYCLVYPKNREAAEIDLTIAIFKDGQPLFRGTPALTPLAQPDKLAALFSIPADLLPPGTYQLKAWAQQGESISVESTVFTVNP